MLKTKIQRGFSKSAKHYDHYSSLHRQIADKLFEQVDKELEPVALLDVGCGTGYLTDRLKDLFPQSKIIGLDFSAGMLQKASCKHDDITWILADGYHLPFCDESFDILVSNLAYQWLGDMSRAFGQARRVLRPGGVFAGTLFGYTTCQELFQALDEASPQALQFTRLPNEAQVRQAINWGGFRNAQVEVELLKVEFIGMQELMTWLKSIGANHLLREGYLGARAVSRAAAIYRERFTYFQGVGATFEVVFVYAKK